MSPDDIGEAAAFSDCMATRGDIQMWLQLDAIDITSDDAASIACAARLPGGNQ